MHRLAVRIDELEADDRAVGLLLHPDDTAIARRLIADGDANLRPRLQRLVNRAELTPEEVHILRGIAKAVEVAAKGRSSA